MTHAYVDLPSHCICQTLTSLDTGAFQAPKITSPARSSYTSNICYMQCVGGEGSRSPPSSENIGAMDSIKEAKSDGHQSQLEEANREKPLEKQQTQLEKTDREKPSEKKPLKKLLIKAPVSIPWMQLQKNSEIISAQACSRGRIVWIWRRIKMRTMLSWLNCFLTLCLTALLILYSFSDLSHNFFSPSPSLQVQAQVYVFDGIQLIQKKGKVRLALNITADFRSLFSWNTEQIFVFVAAEYVTPINSVNQSQVIIFSFLHMKRN
ncbi:hypothetical protein SUGI_0227270 [Cryptomeria japonica]|nr:hypothetical protein SUGI_0227270 [Cryptomeria japonica]